MSYSQIQHFPPTNAGYLASKLYTRLDDYKGVNFSQYSSYLALSVGASKVLRIWYVSTKTARLEVIPAIHGLLQGKLLGWQESNHATKIYTHQCPLQLDYEPGIVAEAVVEMFKLKELKR